MGKIMTRYRLAQMGYSHLTTFWLFLLALSLFCPWGLNAQEAIQITAVRGNQVYLSAGRLQNLAVDHLLSVRRNNREVAQIQVEFVADRSAVCRIIKAGGVIRVGDRAVLIALPDAGSADGDPPADTTTRFSSFWPFGHRATREPYRW